LNEREGEPPRIHHAARRRSGVAARGAGTAAGAHEADRCADVVAFYNKRGTCEQWIKEGKGAVKWTRLSCRTFAANALRLQLHALAYNLDAPSPSRASCRVPARHIGGDGSGRQERLFGCLRRFPFWTTKSSSEQRSI
jgi:hypothetical protein